APVMIRTAVPAPTSTSGGAPAARVPATRSRTGRSAVAAATSAARTANPSMAELAKGGTGSVATAVSASTQPRASSSGVGRGAMGRQRATTWARASSNGITKDGGASHQAFALAQVGEEATEVRAEVGTAERQLHDGLEVR